MASIRCPRCGKAECSPGHRLFRAEPAPWWMRLANAMGATFPLVIFRAAGGAMECKGCGSRYWATVEGAWGANELPDVPAPRIERDSAGELNRPDSERRPVPQGPIGAFRRMGA